MPFTVNHQGIAVQCETVDDVMRLTAAIRAEAPKVPLSDADRRITIAATPKAPADTSDGPHSGDAVEALKLLTAIRKASPGRLLSPDLIKALGIKPRGLGSALIRTRRALKVAGFPNDDFVYQHERTARGREFSAGPEFDECFKAVSAMVQRMA